MAPPHRRERREGRGLQRPDRRVRVAYQGRNVGGRCTWGEGGGTDRGWGTRHWSLRGWWNCRNASVGPAAGPFVGLRRSISSPAMQQSSAASAATARVTSRKAILACYELGPLSCLTDAWYHCMKLTGRDSAVWPGRRGGGGLRSRAMFLAESQHPHSVHTLPIKKMHNPSSMVFSRHTTPQRQSTAAGAAVLHR
jgi:hypothetical protein